MSRSAFLVQSATAEPSPQLRPGRRLDAPSAAHACAIQLLALGLCVFALVGAPAHAQQAGTIVGEVVDGESGENVAGMEVTATSPALQGKIAVVTDEAGRFRLDPLPPGVYTLTFVKEGMTAEPIGDIQLRGAATLRYDAVAYAAASSMAQNTDVVRVVASAPIVDVGSTTTGSVITSDMTRRVPLVAPGARGGAARTFESAAKAVPQVNNDSFGASINGATSPENQYVIDGISVNNSGYAYLGSPLSLEFIDTINVITGGYMPEFGRSMGGLLDVTTKSGGNETHGSVFLNYAPGALEGTRAVAPNEGSAIRVFPKLNYAGDVGVEVGGPIFVDRLWFYAGAAVNQQSFKLTRKLFKATGEEISGTAQDFFAEATGIQGIAKLTWLANADNRVSITLVATPMFSGGNGKFGIDPTFGRPETLELEGDYTALAHAYQSGALDAQVRWNSAWLERKLKFDTGLGYHHELGGRAPSDFSAIAGGTGLADQASIAYRRSSPGPRSITQFLPVPAVAGCDSPDTDNATICPVTTYLAGGPDYIQQQSFDRVQLHHVTSYALDLFGIHVLKAGLDVGYARYDNDRAYAGTRRFRENASGTTFSDSRMFGFLAGPDDPVILDHLRWQTSSLYAGGFLQDSWTAFDVVTVNLGLRYDNEFLYAGDGSLALSLPNQLSPRAGVIFDPFQSGRVKIYGSFARYFQSVPLDLADRAGSSEPQIASIRPAAVCDPTDLKQQKGSCVDPANRLVVNDPESPDQKWILNGGGRTPIDPALRAPSSDEVVAGAEAEIFRDARVGVVYTKRWLNDAIEDMSRDEASTYFIGNPGNGIASDFPRAQRDYDAVTAMFQKQWSEGWLAQASYTLAFLRGNYAGLFRPETEQLDPNINSDFDLKSLTVNRYGPLPGDRTHQLKVYGAREFDAAYDTKFTLGGGAQALSGGPTSFLGSHPIYGEDEVAILPRGSADRLPWEITADVHGGFTFMPVKGNNVEVTVDVFNLFNFQAATLADESYTFDDVNPLQNCAATSTDSCTRADLGKVQTVDGTDLPEESINPNFGQPKQFQAPRTVRFGLRWSF